jgi:Aldo/keto reductase family
MLGKAKPIVSPTRATAKHIFIVSFPCFRTDLSANNLLRNFSESPVTARVAGESSEECRCRLQLSRRLMQRRDEQGIRKPLNITIRLLNSMACTIGVSVEETFPDKHVIACTEESLKNLGLETIDVQQFHVWSDEWVNQGDWLEAVQKLKEQGKLKYFGVSINDFQPENAIKLIETA